MPTDGGTDKHQFERIRKELDMLDQRLDNIDSVVTTLVERVMKQPLRIEIVCPKCGETIQVNITSSIRLGPRSESG